MAHLELGQSNAGLLAIAGDLGERFESHVIGIAVCQPMQFVYGEGYVPVDLFEQDLADIKKESEAAEAEFRAALQTRVQSLEWRSSIVSGTLSGHLAHESRGADLVITGFASGDFFDASRSLNTGDLVMQVGRPVLVAPRSIEVPKLDRMILAWKDTREARRAAFDALPLLKKAGHVAVVEIAQADRLASASENLDDVVGWLKRHGVVAEGIPSLSTGDDAAQLRAIARGRSADVIVAGAYGHSRLREWVLGGVTRDLLLRSDQCSLVSH
jgi:nucleotide-binding universal stress UspA family protein